MTKDLLQCALGVHRFDKKIGKYNFLCSICERAEYCKTSSGYESWYDYDKDGNMIHCKDSDGYEEWYEYDEKGNEIHHRNSTGFKYWYEYDEKGKMIHIKGSDKYEEW